MEGELRRAAFGEPAVPLPAFPSNLPSMLSPATSLPPVLPAATGAAGKTALLAGIVLGAQGRYAAAATLLAELGRTADPVIAAHALTTLAAHRRQLGGHVAARRLDGRALLLASNAGQDAPDGNDPDGLDARGALTDALLGLAADNLGVGGLAVARRMLSAAVARATGWRANVRVGWVTAEIELGAGRPAGAIMPAEAALELATATGARRHVIKGRLVLAAALLGAGAELERAAKLVAESLAEAEKYELSSLSWPAALLAEQLWPTMVDQYRFRVDAVLHAVLLRSDPEGRILARESAWVPV